MDITIKPSYLSGNVVVPPSKSYGHRALICAGLAGNSRITNLGESVDISATIGAMVALGTDGTAEKGVYESRNFLPKGFPDIDCCESGSTLRFMIPIALATCGGGRFIGAKRLFERPLTPYYEMFERMGIEYSCTETGLFVKGELAAGTFNLPGNISSQFISGLLFALPLLTGDSQIKIEGTLESAPYVDMTIHVLEKFGIKIKTLQDGYFIFGNQQYKSAEYEIEADFSQAAFFLSAGAIGGDVTLLGLPQTSRQGDREMIDILRRFGIMIEQGHNTRALPGKLYGIEIDATQIPDLVPILAVTASFAEGETRIVGASRLRIKESDRLYAITTELSKLGADIKETPDGLIIRGKEALSGGVCDAHNDHRIAMSLAIAAQRANGNVTIKGAQCVQKSMPDFWDKYKNLGGKLL